MNNKLFQPRFTRIIQASITLTVLLASSGELWAQDATSATNTNGVVMLLFGATMVMMLFVALILGDRILKVTAADVKGPGAADDYGLMPSASEILPMPSKEEGVASNVKKLSKGMDIRIVGKPPKTVTEDLHAPTYAVKPTDFHGIRPIPKMVVEVGSEVKAGDQLFFDKDQPEIFFTAPVSGEVTEIRRGEKRSIVEVVILADKEIKYKEFKTGNPTDMSREDIKAQMLESGAWCFLKERPFNLMAGIDNEPKAIHISGFNTAPLRPNANATILGSQAEFQAGLDALGKLTEGHVHLNLDAQAKEQHPYYMEAKGVQRNYFEGKHPAGTVGIQIHHIDPINKGDVVWTVDVQDVTTIGRLFLSGKYDPQRAIAIAGPVIKEPKLYATRLGANIGPMIADNMSKEHVRYIAGDVLTGKAIDTEGKGHAGFYDNVVSVIEEGDFHEFMGWILPSYPRPSASVTFPWTLMPFVDHEVNTNTHGERRAFVVTGQYEDVLPMDVYPVHLLKAILAQDFETIEGLGIYELVEEDIALCEFVCTSKQPAQKILRDGIEFMRSQLKLKSTFEVLFYYLQFFIISNVL